MASSSPVSAKFPDCENPSKTSLLQEDRFTSIRRRNRALIIIFLFLIVCLAVFIGGSIISLAVKYNISPESLAIREFCSVASPHFDCAHHFVAAPLNRLTVPYHIFLFSLESALDKLLRINSTIFDSDSNNPEISSVFKNCSILLGRARTRLDRVSAVARANRDIEMMGPLERMDTVARMDKSMKDLRSCSLDLKNVRLQSADLGEIDMKSVGEVCEIVDVIKNLVMSSKDFLRHCYWINERFYRKRAEISRTRFVETMMVLGMQRVGSLLWIQLSAYLAILGILLRCIPERVVL